MSPAEAIVFVVDDDASMLRALARLLATAGRRVEAFGSPREFLDRPAHDGPGCLVLDLKMPGLSGLDVQEALASGSRALPIVFISGHGRIPAAVRAMKAGAVDFLTKPFEDDALLASVETAIQRSVALRADDAEARTLEARLRTLTPREREVLPLVAQGLPNKQIASRLGTSLQTIKVHRARIMAKMQAGSLADLVRMASRAGIST
jgi:RNA polymerase sigma factor (sigma-70 family)